MTIPAALVELGGLIAGRLIEAVAKGARPEGLTVGDLLTRNERRRLVRAANVLRAQGAPRRKDPA